ncbi:tumor necrosis factor receptor superfamily member 5 [Neosynchiropus ocellatus]
MAFLSLLVLTSAQHQCDPTTEYKQDGVCCKKCDPGTKMLTTGTCLHPVCQRCAEDEYQDSYTTENKCKLQPYCDPNKNFQVIKSSTSLIICQCKVGFKCSSERDCVTCVIRPTCPPGHQATNIGDQRQDTVCEKCQAGTFSSQSSWNNTCARWAECEHGEEMPGTDTTDRTCKEEPRNHIVIPIAIVLVFITVLGVPLLRKRAEETEDPSISSGGNLVTQEQGKSEQCSVEESRYNMT